MMSDERVYLIEEDIEPGMHTVPIGVVVAGGKKGAKATLLIQGMISTGPKRAPKLTWWQRFRKWARR